MITERVADVAIDPRSGGAEALYTYRVDGVLTVGDAVFVPVGSRTNLGFVTNVYDAAEEDLGFPFASLKTVLGPVHGLTLPKSVIELARFIAQEYLCTLPVALSAGTPPGVRDRMVTTWNLAGQGDGAPNTPMQEEVLRVMRESGGFLVDQKGKRIEAGVLRSLRLLQNRGIVTKALRILPFPEKRKGEQMLQLTSDGERVEGFLHREGKKKPAQAITLMRLQTAEAARLTASEIKVLAGVTETTIKALLEAGLLERFDPDTVSPTKPPTPNAAQQLAIDAVAESVGIHEHRPFLLYGVTGSGKTEVYLRAASEALNAGRQVLYLVPEIALATQAIAQLRARFGSSVSILHSELPANERLNNWMRIRDGQSSIVLGARSALFAPLDNIGLIVVDEEHEASYKQESAPRYHSKALALFLGRLHSCPVVLGSATPSIESFNDAEKEHPEFTLLSLPHRAAKAELPAVYVDDLTEGYKRGKPGILSVDLHRRIEDALDTGRQVILFLNRRAYSPFIICRDCGFQMQCPNCTVSLSYHRKDGRLRCHHCGYQARPPEVCPQCGGERLNPFGVGTEKVEETVSLQFPNAFVARLDRDIARRKGALEDILTRFRSGEIQILVGTQMIAKGLDFPNVTVVGVIAADVSLNIPDFRSSERTFQLLSQVAGRAGRGTAFGSVVIQTFNPKHVSILTAQAHDFVSFYEAMSEERKAAGYPPFRRLVNVTFSGEDRAAVVSAGEEALERLRPVGLIGQLLGPVDCAVDRLQNRWRRHILVKLPPNSSAAPVGDALLGFAPKGVQVVIDVDPYSLM
ncbi:MAG: primosomal protein N' [Fimbriimonas sp.]|nr:primosomal protein N' [Fimbriimonas sp.]